MYNGVHDRRLPDTSAADKRDIERLSLLVAAPLRSSTVAALVLLGLP